MEQPAPPDPDWEVLKARLAALEGRLRGRALQHTGNEVDADDLVQQTLLRAWERRHEERNGHLEGWLFKVMRNLWIDECRRRRSHPAAPLENADALPSPDGDPTLGLRREDVGSFPAMLRDSLAGDGQGRLVRFIDALRTCGLEKDRIAEAMGFSETRSVDAYLSDLRKWCRAHGLTKEHYVGILCPILLALFEGTAGAAEPGGGTSALGKGSRRALAAAVASLALLCGFVGGAGDDRTGRIAAVAARLGKGPPAGDKPGVGERPAKAPKGGGLAPADVRIPGM